MELLNSLVGQINDILWSYVLIILLIGAGIIFTIRTKFVQIRFIKEMIRLIAGDAGNKMEGQQISSFQAFCVSTASRVGVGNIAGIAIAVVLGGPGAIFWMWIIAILGSATGFVESTLAQIYKVPRTDSNGYLGGPAYYINNALHSPKTAVFFAILISVTYGLIFNSVQSNTISLSLQTAFNFDATMIGIVIAVFSGIVVFGGLHRIAKVTEYMVPIMAGIYLLIAFAITIYNISELPTVLSVIFKDAWGIESVAGGSFGAAIMTGIKRGLFSNEAGMGSTPHAHARAAAKNPHEQGLTAMVSVFIDTFIILNLTAFSILTSGVLDSGKEGIALTQTAFVNTFGSGGDIFIAVCLLFFAFSTILGWHFFGRINVKYLFGQKAVKIYSLIVILFIIVGSTLKVELVWQLADCFNGLMVIPNAIALFALSGVVMGIYKKYVNGDSDKDEK